MRGEEDVGPVGGRQSRGKRRERGGQARDPWGGRVQKRLAAPFAPFTGDLSDIDRLEIIRTWKFARGDRLSSN
ncbi:hypothetical protein B1218_33020 [Pseudomonas ogarae]|nr:hypothetical protein B1218_33020 [Pseudomonas ogarae]